MHYGLQISTSGAMTSLYRQDVLTGNLANLNTVGYQPLIPSAKARDVASVEDGLSSLPSNRMLEKLGAGVVPGPQRIGFGQGPIENTGNPLDLAIQGDGFFTVRGNDGVTNLTRDGRFTLDEGGQLVTTVGGRPVLDDAGRAIRIDPAGGPVDITADGSIIRDGQTIARIHLAEPADRGSLIKLGEGLFGAEGGRALDLDDATGRIQQGAVEQSAVNEIRAMMQVQAAARSAQGNLGMITYHDRLMDAAINRLGRTT